MALDRTNPSSYPAINERQSCIEHLHENFNKYLLRDLAFTLRRNDTLTPLRAYHYLVCEGIPFAKTKTTPAASPIAILTRLGAFVDSLRKKMREV
jgi:hypothetical protein